MKKTVIAMTGVTTLIGLGIWDVGYALMFLLFLFYVSFWFLTYFIFSGEFDMRLPPPARPKKRSNKKRVSFHTKSP